MNAQQQPQQPARARASEKVAWWIVAGLILLYLFSLFVEWIHLNLAALLVLVIGLILILWRLLKPTAPVGIVECLEDCSELQFRHTGTELPVNPKDSEVLPDGPNWIAFFWHSGDDGTPLAYRYDPTTRAVIGREINWPDLIMARIERSKVLANLAADTHRRRQERAAAERAGYDPSDIEDAQGGNDAR